MRVLITGGAGMVGSHVAELLEARGDEVIIVDNFASNIVTASAEQDAVTDGAGLEGSGTLQARFIKLATVN